MRRLVLGLAVAGVASVGLAGAPVGQRFPSVRGRSLAGAEVRLPGDLGGAPAVLLVAYRRGTQPDVDHWTALLEREAPGTAWLELPTIRSVLWRPLAGWIDGGMRRGVPHERWQQVVTLYDDASAVAAFLGDQGGLRAHVVLLDAQGGVRWFSAAGFSPAAGQQLVDALRGLEESCDRQQP